MFVYSFLKGKKRQYVNEFRTNMSDIHNFLKLRKTQQTAEKKITDLIINHLQYDKLSRLW